MSGSRNEACHGCGLVTRLLKIATLLLEVIQLLTILSLRLVLKRLRDAELLRRSVRISVLSIVAANANVYVLLRVSEKDLRLGRLHSKRVK